MPLMDECSKSREELIEEVQAMRRELALLKSRPQSALGAGDSVPAWPQSLVDEMDQFVEAVRS